MATPIPGTRDDSAAAASRSTPLTERPRANSSAASASVETVLILVSGDDWWCICDICTVYSLGLAALISNASDRFGMFPRIVQSDSAVGTNPVEAVISPLKTKSVRQSVSTLPGVEPAEDDATAWVVSRCLSRCSSSPWRPLRRC